MLVHIGLLFDPLLRLHDLLLVLLQLGLEALFFSVLLVGHLGDLFLNLPLLLPILPLPRLLELIDTRDEISRGGHAVRGRALRGLHLLGGLGGRETCAVLNLPLVEALAHTATPHVVVLADLGDAGGTSVRPSSILGLLRLDLRVQVLGVVALHQLLRLGERHFLARAIVLVQLDNGVLLLLELVEREHLGDQGSDVVRDGKRSGQQHKVERVLKDTEDEERGAIKGAEEEVLYGDQDPWDQVTGRAYERDHEGSGNW
mmetsp:Transcript_11610/g.29013  ORF Transcript_11610/g.29013 Transcript_11610/m.29013 type:complete len:258 (+) Transcript_11610:311-1084(+)